MSHLLLSLLASTMLKSSVQTPDPMVALWQYQWQPRHQTSAADCNTQPTAHAIQVYRYNSHTVILRQQKCQHFEAPFLYLLFGNERALLLDTGAVANREQVDVEAQVRALVHEYLAHQLPTVTPNNYPVWVAHLHSHDDHYAGDGQFAKPPYQVVAPNLSAVQQAFGFNAVLWPQQQVEFSLGGRTLQILAIPGHQTESIAIYDGATKWLLTGDTFYPGRLYVRDWAAFKDSIRRLLHFSQQHSISALLGTHIEMSNQAGIDYPAGSLMQPDERPLPLAVSDLQLLDVLLQRETTPKRLVTPRFIVWPLSTP